eukprot:3293909-Pyramimonas_sp.AAC.1
MGRLTAYANPWAKQFFEDVQALGDIEDGRELLERLQGSFLALWWDKELGKAFCKIDFFLLRRRLHTVAIPPPEYDPQLSAMFSTEIVQGGAVKWVCGVYEHICDPSDTIGRRVRCDAKFPDKKS